MSLVSEISQYEHEMAIQRDLIQTISQTLQRSDEPFSKHVLSAAERELLLQAQGKERYRLYSLENRWRELLAFRRRLHRARKGVVIGCCFLSLGSILFFRANISVGTRIAILFLGSMWVLKDGLALIEERFYDQRSLRNFLEANLLQVVGLSIGVLMLLMVWIGSIGYLCLLLFLLYVYLLFQAHKVSLGF